MVLPCADAPRHSSSSKNQGSGAARRAARAGASRCAHSYSSAGRRFSSLLADGCGMGTSLGPHQGTPAARDRPCPGPDDRFLFPSDTPASSPRRPPAGTIHLPEAFRRGFNRRPPYAAGRMKKETIIRARRAKARVYGAISRRHRALCSSLLAQFMQDPPFATRRMHPQQKDMLTSRAVLALCRKEQLPCGNR
jgi:hypothetical protein